MTQGMKWHPIETALKGEYGKKHYIIIAQYPCLANVVIWRDERPERVINGNKCLKVPKGWFCCGGGRTILNNPTHWMKLPTFEKRLR